MTIISATPRGSGDAYERLVQSLQMEFGSSEVCLLAARILESEKAEFHWDARVQERYLGQHLPADLGDDEAGDELARIAILSFLAGRWHAGICLVDGNGCAADLLWLRSYDAREDATDIFARAR
jgi:hypothetical protein